MLDLASLVDSESHDTFLLNHDCRLFIAQTTESGEWQFESFQSGKRVYWTFIHNFFFSPFIADPRFPTFLFRAAAAAAAANVKNKLTQR